MSSGEYQLSIAVLQATQKFSGLKQPFYIVDNSVGQQLKLSSVR